MWKSKKEISPAGRPELLFPSSITTCFKLSSFGAFEEADWFFESGGVWGLLVEFFRILFGAFFKIPFTEGEGCPSKKSFGRTSENNKNLKIKFWHNIHIKPNFAKYETITINEVSHGWRKLKTDFLAVWELVL